ADTDLHAGPSDVVDRGSSRHEVADVDRRGERKLVDARRTTRARAWRVAAAPAAESISFMISPPCTLPYGLASEGSIIRDITVFELATVFASSGTRAILSLASPRDRSLSRGASRRPRGLTASCRR